MVFNRIHSLRGMLIPMHRDKREKTELIFSFSLLTLAGDLKIYMYVHVRYYIPKKKTSRKWHEKKTKALQEFQRNRMAMATATTITKRHPWRDDIWIEDYTRRWLVTDNMPSNRKYDDKANRSADEEIRKSKCMTSVMHNNHRFRKLSKNAKYITRPLATKMK